jgi:galactokinase
MSSFEEVFGSAPTVVADAPGRVNLMGEHTDYNDGYVLPIAIEQRTRVAMRHNGADQHALYSEMLDSTVRFKLDQPPAEHFATYVYGCLMEARGAGVEAPSLDIHVQSDVPMGVGLSSSAALEVATLRALRALTGSQLDDVRIAQLGQRAEIEYAGVRVGIMDQMASSLADIHKALFLDTRTLERRLVPLPPASAVLVINSGVARTLATSGYNQRRAECEEAARRLGVAALRDVKDIAVANSLPEPLRSRVRHIVSENARVLRAVHCSNAAEFGLLMNASHASLRDDYQVSVPELDYLVALLQAHPRVYGARLTGAGFGGACVALCEPEALHEIAAAVLRDYERAGFNGRLLVPSPAATNGGAVKASTEADKAGI